MPVASPTDKRDPCRDARQAIDQRRAILGPCLAAMGFSEHGAPPPDLPESLTFAGTLVSLESWERDLLLGNSASNSAVLLAHFAEGLAFLALSGYQLQGIARELPRSPGPGRVPIEMVEATAVGSALQQEVQRDIDRLVRMGEMGDAKRLTGFRRKIDQALAQLEQRIGEQARKEAQARSVELLTPRDVKPTERRQSLPPVEKGLTLEDLYAIEEKLEKRAIEKQALESMPEPSAEELIEASLRQQESGITPALPLKSRKSRSMDPARRFRLLMALLVISAVAYAVVFFSTREVAPPPKLGTEHFRHIEAVLDVKPRPPSLFVRVKTSTWAALPDPEKMQVVEELGRIAGEQGYQGVQVKSGDGINVAQWLRKTGPRLIAPRTTGS